MKLSYAGIQDREAWKKAGITLPAFDWEDMRRRTGQSPVWIHFGAGNIFRGFIAGLQQDLLDQGLVKEGILAAEAFDYGLIDKIYDPFDCMALMVSLTSDGGMEKKVIASIAAGLRAGQAYPQDMEALRAAVQNPGLQMISFTITEKGYELRNMQGDYLPAVQKDFKTGPSGCTHTMCIAAKLLLERFQAGAQPIAVVSMDNCSRNGEKLRSSVLDVVSHWLDNGLVPKAFADWAGDETKVAFPWSMIDKITPRPSPEVEARLTALGLEDMKPIVTEKNTFIAPFVNAEVCQYLVIEDSFPNGRPPLEKAGVYMTDRETVNKTEKMKVLTCLNPLHTALAVFGCTLGFTKIADEMRDQDLKTLVTRMGYEEGMKAVVDPRIIQPEKFIREVIEERFPNPFIPDTPQRIATDTSQKVSIRLGETIRAYIQRPDLDPADLRFIPLVIAGWLRYLLGVDDNGQAMECSSDPLLEELQGKLKDIRLDGVEPDTEVLDSILSSQQIFGLDLVRAGLSKKIRGMFGQMIQGPGAVRRTLHRYVTAE